LVAVERDDNSPATEPDQVLTEGTEPSPPNASAPTPQEIPAMVGRD
jgi:hypothetical protein